MKKGKHIEPGCLALIVRAKWCKENLGRVVRVLRRPDPYESMTTAKRARPWGQTTWVCEVLPGHPDLFVPVVATGSRTLIRKVSARRGCFGEGSLVRIDDDEQPQEETANRERELTLSGELT